MILSTRLSDHFAQKLVTLILEKYKNQNDLARVQLILPTRRACRTVKDAFLQHARLQPILLPRLIALYDIEALNSNLPPACSPMERTILLTRLCQAKPNVDSLAGALKIALGLGTLLDEFYQFEVSTEALDSLVQEERFAEHWTQTLAFLDIIRIWWPRILKERGQIDAMDRTIRQINVLNEQLIKSPPKNPIILAGFDGGLKAVNRLIKTLNNIDNALILFDGFDFNVSDDFLKSADENHPLFKKMNVLNETKTPPCNVHSFDGKKDISEREKLIWQAFSPDTVIQSESFTQQALNDVNLLECPTSSTEALACALILRKTLETPEKTAALVTPDRTLARRVIGEMKRFGVNLDDSAGVPLLHTSVGLFFSLILDVAETFNLKTRPLNALFKHPFLENRAKNLNLNALEVSARRSYRPMIFSLPPKTTAFFQLAQNHNRLPAKKWLTHLIECALELIAPDDTVENMESAQKKLWSKEAGQTAFELNMSLTDTLDMLPDPIEISDFKAFVNLMMMNESVRPAYGTHPRLSILGPIEARLFHPDVCVIASLNEGTFPDIAETGPWLNRPMRHSLGLPLPETKTASIASDFMHCFCAPEVWLTRSLKSGGSPTVPSRFLSRLEAVIEGAGITFQKENEIAKLKIDAALKTNVPTRPMPRPPVNKRPRELSATRIELWMRNPYAIYARYILKLIPLPELEEKRTQQLFGSLVHEILEDFFKTAKETTSYTLLSEYGQRHFEKSSLTLADKALFWPQFEKIAEFIIHHQRLRQDITQHVFVEATGKMVLNRPGGPFVLKARADRIDLMKSNNLEIIDYKTGTVPSSKEILAGFSPQLPLEGLILTQGGFNEIACGSLPSLSHLKLSGRSIGGEVKNVLSKRGETDINTVLQKTQAGLERLIDTFDNPDTPYEATPIPGRAPRYDDYAHLARTREWMNETEEDEV